MEATPTGASDLPAKPVTIVDCGELLGDKKLTGRNARFLTNYIDI
jgi:hypothetical protein